MSNRNKFYNNIQIVEENVKWIESGKIGCVFASRLIKMRDLIKWHFYIIPHMNCKFKIDSYSETSVLSMIFPNQNKETVKEWCLDNGFYEELLFGTEKEDGTNDWFIGLRYKLPNGSVAWVQYFGPDSHVKTRQTPHPMISFTVNLPTHIYAKTMKSNIYHLAHASIEFLSGKKADTLWARSIAQTKKLLGHKPDLSEAAKTTFKGE